MVSEYLQRASSGLGVFISSGATLVSYVTLNDIAVLLGILSTILLAWINYSGHKQRTVENELKIEKLRLENKKLKGKIKA